VVDGVSSALLPSAWPLAWPLIKKAIDRVPVPNPTKRAEVLLGLARCQSQLWVALDTREDIMIGAVVTAIEEDTRFPGCKYVHCKFAGGTRRREWVTPLWSILKAWGRSHDCTHMMIPGRAGWSRLLGLEYLYTNDVGVRVYARSLKEH
jgi:hypothetical protein